MNNNNNSTTTFSLSQAFNQGYLSVPMLYTGNFSVGGFGQILGGYGINDPSRLGYARAHDILNQVLHQIRKSYAVNSGFYLHLPGPWDSGARGASFLSPLAFATPNSLSFFSPRWPQQERPQERPQQPATERRRDNQRRQCPAEPEPNRPRQTQTRYWFSVQLRF